MEYTKACPGCGSPDSARMDSEVSDDEILVEFECMECGTGWVERYKYAGDEIFRRGLKKSTKGDCL